MTVTLFCADSETHVPSAVTRPRLASRCVCGQARTKWGRHRWGSASPLTLDSAMQKSSGSPRRKEARSCTACSYGWSKKRLARGYQHHLPHYQPNFSAEALRILALFCCTGSLICACFRHTFVFVAFRRMVMIIPRDRDAACTLCFGHWWAIFSLSH